MRNHLRDAIEDALLVVEQAPHIPAVYYTAGNFLREDKNYEKACEMYQRGFK